MKKKHIELINYLRSTNQVTTSKALASALSVSVRSIKNYVEEINLLNNPKLITSTKTGYFIDKEAAKLCLRNETSELPQNSDERMHYIIKLLLIEHASQLDIFDLCDTLYISYSTLKNDITKMNKNFANFNVSFVCENDHLSIQGNEKNKRKLVSYIMYEETNSQFMSSSILKDCFKSLPIDVIATNIKDIFKKHNYYLNDFAFMNILLHFAIIIDRIKVGKNVVEQNERISIENENEELLIKELCTTFEDLFAIHFSPAERFELYMLFRTNANYTIPSNEETLRKIVGDDVIQLANDICEQINERYYVDLRNENFMSPFSLHLKNLILRAKEGKFTKNPMTQSIKSSCPTVYDMAIFISLEIINKYNVKIIEDEVTFLALHIGAEIERQKSNDDKLKVVFLCPDYRERAVNLYNQLLFDFGQYIDIIKTVSYESEIDCHSDLLITTIPVERTYKREVLTIPPLSTKIDRTHIYSVLDRLCKNRKFFILRRNFDNFFEKDLFYLLPNNVSKEEVLHMLCSKMIKKKYVKSNFEEMVNIRENAASTAFGNIAIPHSMDMDAFKTSIAMAISTEGIEWGSQLINIVMLVAINKTDNKIFHELYEALVEMFSDDQIIFQTKNLTDFHDFENMIHLNVKEITK